MSLQLVCNLKSYIQPFERRLALMELKSLAGRVPVPHGRSDPPAYRVRTSRSIEQMADALTYWESVAIMDNGRKCHTRQVRREATVGVLGKGIRVDALKTFLPFNGNMPVPNRRVLRYGPHGIHEYRGKFFPQLVRVILNIENLKPGDIVIDPMCGSGTTAVEASLYGCAALGIDMNPLSVLMTRTKCSIIKTNPEILYKEYNSLKIRIASGRRLPGSLPWFETLPNRDRAYLSSWFSPRVLADLDPIVVGIGRASHSVCRDLFRLCLSNILRGVSWQKDADLRVRKEILPDNHIDVFTEFREELEKTVRTVLAFLYEEQGFRGGTVEIVEGDARLFESFQSLFLRVGDKAKAIITSPPYAMALPYLDTDRLSLSYLGLLSRPQHRIKDYEMIGNREITDSQRWKLCSYYESRRHLLPNEIRKTIDHVHRLNEGTQVGFRRRNLSALLPKYFLDMHKVLQNSRNCLKKGGSMYMVIGNNHTIAGGQRVDIETDRLLGLLGQSIGFTLEDSIPMDMLMSRDIFKKNSVKSETILCFRKC